MESSHLGLEWIYGILLIFLMSAFVLISQIPKLYANWSYSQRSEDFSTFVFVIFFAFLFSFFSLGSIGNLSWQYLHTLPGWISGVIDLSCAFILYKVVIPEAYKNYKNFKKTKNISRFKLAVIFSMITAACFSILFVGLIKLMVLI